MRWYQKLGVSGLCLGLVYLGLVGLISPWSEYQLYYLSSWHQAAIIMGKFAMGVLMIFSFVVGVMVWAGDDEEEEQENENAVS